MNKKLCARINGVWGMPQIGKSWGRKFYSGNLPIIILKGTSQKLGGTFSPSFWLVPASFIMRVPVEKGNENFPIPK